MNPILKNILAVVAGIVVGSIVNMGAMSILASVISYPEGYDMMDPISLAEHMPNFQWQHFIPPFAGHALGTLVGAFLASFLAANNKMTFGLVIGAWFLIGGIYMITLVPSPTWFTILDLVLGYIPMAYLGANLGISKSN